MSSDNRSQETRDEHTQRDSETFRMLGAFLAVLSCIVLLAAIFQDPGHARVVNAGAGVVLLCLGLSMFMFGLKLRKR